ncbi:MAG: proton-conducting transporter membrane subunit [Ignisphaera sp.]|uniref:NADH:quinone oxidoreductase/Mrp antiporter transmembrane domain-containing protein n=1 Tax=Ignisphaera aggregans TaxID=334771 RepID=A0A832EVY9_9CREN
MFNHELALIPLVPTIIALIIPLLALVTRNRYIYSFLQLSAAIMMLILSLIVLKNVLQNGAIVYAFGGWPPPMGIVYVADFINAVYGLLACTIFFLVSLYTFWYYKVIRDYVWHTLLFLLLVTGITGCIYTGDIFNFFVMLEVLALSSYALVSFFKKRKWAIEASASYAFIGSLATTFFLFGVSFLYLSFGTLNIADLSAKAHNYNSIMSHWSGNCTDNICIGNIVLASATATAFMIWALTFEAGLFPNNYWLPSAYTEAPTPASAIFAGIVDKVGIYGILRLFLTIFTPYGSTLMFRLWGVSFRDFILYVLSVLGFITGLLGALIMTIQKDIKRLLSYSTISHIGLMFMAMAGLTSSQTEVTIALTLTGIIFHSITHALGESMVFMGLGTLASIANSRKINDIYGYGTMYPYLSIAIVIGLLSLLGIAPLAGFFSKYILFLALISANFIYYAIALIVISGITAIGYFKLIYALFLQKPKENKKRVDVTIATIVCMIMAIGLMILGMISIQGEPYTFLYSNNIHVSSIDGVKQYIKIVEDIARILGDKP